MMSQGKVLPSEIGLTNVKFDTALILTRLRFYHDNYPLKKVRDLRLLELQGITEHEIEDARIGVEIIGHLLTNIQCNSSFPNIESFQDGVTYGLNSLHIQEYHLLDQGSQKTKEEYLSTETDDQLKITPKILNQFYEAMTEIDSVLESHRRISNVGFKFINNHPKVYKDRSCIDTHSMNATWNLAKGMILCKIPGLPHWLLSLDQFLMIHNKIHEIFNVLFIGWAQSGKIWSSDFFKCQIDLLNFMVRKVKSLGNQSYTLFKNFDGIATGYILAQDKTLKNTDPIKNVLAELMSCKIITRRDKVLLERCFNREKHESLEMSAMSKLVGHPDIDSVKGLNKLRGRTFKPNEVDRQEVADLISSMVKNFIQHYLMKYKQWPVVEFSPSSSKTLVYCSFKGIWIHDKSIPTHLPPVTLRDFSQIKIGKVANFDFMDSQFDILKDTALAETRSIIYDPTLRSVSSLKMRRTLVYFLISNSPHTKVREYMHHFKIQSPLCLEYCVIKLTQKERELKEEGRLFGQSPYEERARRCILEYNISKMMEKYNRNQAMTLTELQKFQKLYVLSSLSKRFRDYYVVYISADVEAFNNNFRDTVCGPVGREFFDRILGLEGEYETLMHIFHNSVFILSDGVDDYLYEGQLGGIEGLAQKPWTWIYEAVASRVAEMTGYTYYIMVNGDDLRVILLIPRSEVPQSDLKDHLDKIAENFEKNYGKYGFNLKLQETYKSTELLGFGKVYTSEGVFFSQTLKKGAKLHGLANLMGDYPLEYIKGVFSEGVSTMAYSVNHRYIYILVIIRYLWYLNKYYPDFKNLTEQQKILTTLFPSNFGGFPILPYLRFLYKGDSDLETCWWSLYYFILKWDPPLGEALFKLVTSQLTRTKDYSGLAANPFSLPNSTPPDGISLIKQYIRNKIPQVTKNKEFKALLRQASPQRTKTFIKSLYSCNVIAAKPLSVLYETSACGIINEFVNRFDTSKSIGALITNRFLSIPSIKILQRAKKSDITKISYLINEIKSYHKKSNTHLYLESKNHTDCPTRFSDIVRAWCYYKPIVGITYPCIVDQIKILRGSEVDPSVAGAITFWKEAIPSNINPNYSHGKGATFLGSHTHLKLHSPDLELSQSSPGMKRLSKLLKIYAMMKKLGPQCIQYLERNLEDITGLPADLLKTITYEYQSGSITHRVPTNHWSPLVGPNEFSNRSSFIKSTTRTDPKLKTMGGDFTINFSHIRSHVNLILMYKYEFKGLNNPSEKETCWAVISDCKSCTYEVTDEPLAWNLP